MFDEKQLARIARFTGQLGVELRAVLDRLGCSVPAGADESSLCLAYASYVTRRIAPAPRHVQWSDVLQARRAVENPENVYLEALAAKAAGGDDLFPHQSKGLLRPLHRDGLWGDWGIHHLHLGGPAGKPVKDSRFVPRSEQVLFVRVTDDDIYFLDVRTHRRTADPPWWEVGLVETVHRNWPSSIQHHRREGFRPHESEDLHRRVRPSKGCVLNTFVTVSDGTAYMLTAGMVTTGASTTARLEADRLLRTVRDLALQSSPVARLTLSADHRGRVELGAQEP